MADAIQLQVANPTFFQTGAGSPAVGQQITNLGAQRVAQLEAQGYEMSRSGRSFVGGIIAVAGGIAPVADLPTTTAPISLFNSAPASASPPKVLVVKSISFAYASGTLSAFGSSLFAGVSPSKLATALVANGSNIKTQATRGTGSPFGFIDVAKTITAPTWLNLGGIAHGAETTMCLSYTVDLSRHPFIVPPGFVLSAGVLSALDGFGATTPLYMVSFGWDECEANLP